MKSMPADSREKRTQYATVLAAGPISGRIASTAARTSDQTASVSFTPPDPSRRPRPRWMGLWFYASNRPVLPRIPGEGENMMKRFRRLSPIVLLAVAAAAALAQDGKFLERFTATGVRMQT